MDQLFSRDTIQTRSILDMVCGFLFLKDLFSLQGVSRLSRLVVQSHHYDGDDALLGWPANAVKRKLVTRDGTRMSGPIFTKMSLILEIDNQISTNWPWMLNTLKSLAPHVKQLLIQIDWPAFSSNRCDLLNEQAEDLLGGVAFEACELLEVSFGLEKIGDPAVEYSRLLPGLLRHFPSVTDLALNGAHLSLLGRLPAPQKVKNVSLNYYLTLGGTNTRQNPQLVLPIIDLKHIKELEIGVHPHAPVGLQFVWRELNYSADEMRMRCLTGVNWSESLARHPPGRLAVIKLPQLTSWNLDLLARCVPTCRSLTIKVFYAGNLNQWTAGQFPCLTNLTIERFVSERDVCSLLALTPSLETLRLTLNQPNFVYRHVNVVCDLDHPLRALTRLELTDQFGSLRHDWLRSIQHKASPAGLKILMNGQEMDLQ